MTDYQIPIDVSLCDRLKTMGKGSCGNSKKFRLLSSKGDWAHDFSTNQTAVWFSSRQREENNEELQMKNEEWQPEPTS